MAKLPSQVPLQMLLIISRFSMLFAPLFAPLSVGCLKRLKQILLFLSQNSISHPGGQAGHASWLYVDGEVLDVTDLGVICNLANTAVLGDIPSEKFQRWNLIMRC